MEKILKESGRNSNLSQVLFFYKILINIEFSCSIKAQGAIYMFKINNFQILLRLYIVQLYF